MVTSLCSTPEKLEESQSFPGLNDESTELVEAFENEFDPV
jgi:hypothetical protein